MLTRRFRTLVSALTLGFAASAFAATDPSLHEVYDALEAGHVAEAQQMMRQVLQDHPSSAKAHYVAAEVDARAGDFPAARQELATAEGISPTLPFAKPESVRELRRELSGAPNRIRPVTDARSFPWGLTLLFGVLIVGILWVLFRRAATPAPYAPLQNGGAPGFGQPGYGQPGYGAPGYGGGPMGGGGSGLLGNLASGMAVGAGVVAGEELVRHMISPAHAGERDEFGQQTVVDDPGTNADMGGNDFGVSGGSWDDGGAGGGGGDDWS
jgi:hypothetical protein